MSSWCDKNSSSIDFMIGKELRNANPVCSTLRLRYWGLRLRVIPGDEAPEDSARVDETGAGELGKERGHCHQERWGPQQNKSRRHPKGKWLLQLACKEVFSEVEPCRGASELILWRCLSPLSLRRHQSSQAWRIHPRPRPGSPVDPQNTRVEIKAWALGRKRRRCPFPRLCRNQPGGFLLNMAKAFGKLSC